ncbi:hypothetical protein KFK09_018634 [Dendrobium nobile]|uniref:Uncharacterized protein n=1 Tax=Dendrobium nobile TaxID=94219 RepID=A0A8T3AXL9_DENNO|nr:hypothetical protein KFK09_018634 [Dendrobium nobile]
MGPAKCRIESKKEFQKKVRRLSALHGVGAFLVVLPPKTSTDFIVNHYRSRNPLRRPDTNQEQQRISKIEELAELKKVIEKVRARILFLESASKQNADNSSHQSPDRTASISTVVADANANH